ncbi:MAG: hypothetical protein U1F98_03205 [Verrucomicrobiota bacterium]
MVKNDEPEKLPRPIWRLWSCWGPFGVWFLRGYLLLQVVSVVVCRSHLPPPAYIFPGARFLLSTELQIACFGLAASLIPSRKALLVAIGCLIAIPVLSGIVLGMHAPGLRTEVFALTGQMLGFRCAVALLIWKSKAVQAWLAPPPSDQA